MVGVLDTEQFSQYRPLLGSEWSRVLIGRKAPENNLYVTSMKTCYSAYINILMALLFGTIYDVIVAKWEETGYLGGKPTSDRWPIPSHYWTWDRLPTELPWYGSLLTDLLTYYLQNYSGVQCCVLTDITGGGG